MSRRGIAISALVLIAVAISTPVLVLRGSLPLTDGRRAMAGLAATVTIERDALGIPTITGASRRDVAFATGFVHAQDRLFQMDLSRRMAAGRLAELVGDAALPVDRRNRLHRFEALAGRVLAAATDEERSLLEAYAAGVNAGLDSLRVRPFEYLLLRARPEPWVPRDTVLVIYAMYLQLNDARAEADLRRGALRDSLPDALFRFVHAPAPEWEAPIDGAATEVVPTPGPEIIDLRSPAAETLARRSTVPLRREPAAAGSNNWAIAGSRTASGAGLVANDMHLGLGGAEHLVSRAPASCRATKRAISLVSRCLGRRCWSPAATAVSPGASRTATVTTAISCASSCRTTERDTAARPDTAHSLVKLKFSVRAVAPPRSSHSQ